VFRAAAYLAQLLPAIAITIVLPDGNFVRIANRVLLGCLLLASAKAIFSNVRDASKGRRAEASREYRRVLVEAIHAMSLDGILVVDERENVVSYNRRFGEFCGIKLPAELPGTYGDDFKIPDSELLAQMAANTKEPEAFIRRVKEIYADPDEDDHCQIELRDGRTLERYTTALRNNIGRYMGRVWFFRDISKHKLNERRLQEAYLAVETLAITDALTGLANRRRFDQYLASEWRRGLRENHPVSLLLMDADRFKPYNDHYGHLNGDTCLKQIAEVAQLTATRSADLVARFGGEEFAVILPNTPHEGAIEIANAISENVRARKLPHAGSPAGIMTVSIGCATVTPQAGANPAWLIELADQALYKAKRSGRDQVHVATLCEATNNPSKTLPIRPSTAGHGN
jgi:diguanylate cyclase (GGDEF)-like protein